MIPQKGLSDTKIADKYLLFSDFIDARRTRRYDQLTEMMADDVVFTIAGDRRACRACGVFSGKQQACDALRTLDMAFEIPDDFEIVSFIVDGDCVAAHLSCLWRSRGTGRTLPRDFFLLVEFDGVLVKRWTVFLDTAVLAEFLGEAWTSSRDNRTGASVMRGSPSVYGSADFDFQTLIGQGKAPSPDADTITHLVRTIFSARDRGDYAAYEECISEDAVLTIAGNSARFHLCGTYWGKQGFRAAVRAAGANWRRVGAADASRLFIDHGRAALIRRNVWQHHATGATVEFESANLFKFKNGKLAEAIVFLDTAALARTLEDS